MKKYAIAIFINSKQVFYHIYHNLRLCNFTLKYIFLCGFFVFFNLQAQTNTNIPLSAYQSYDIPIKSTFIDRLLWRIFNYKKFAIPEPKCDLLWQDEICTGDFMCYASKCFYQSMRTETLYASILHDSIERLRGDGTPKSYEIIAQLTKILEFGLPFDNKKHEFNFVNSDSVKCQYWLWKKDSETLELNLTGCEKDKKKIYTFIEKQEEIPAKRGVIELYNYIAY
ncbi:hypothetical protein CQA53_02805 [Helicobacter didelphidarum]|uniref:Uncharacterized protein n=1 Tax=Helicobacter didelphidarum TaxID=2040648 RepID=A0A3D8IN66_9HELI|nr:hypothetical protein [Helicobacter didelphidarum]RDU66717.1 hypothetical protein CQA53_02805 [Helicobacter didelphidarum]